VCTKLVRPYGGCPVAVRAPCRHHMLEVFRVGHRLHEPSAVNYMGSVARHRPAPRRATPRRYVVTSTACPRGLTGLRGFFDLEA
jgi:hypothetical protein